MPALNITADTRDLEAALGALSQAARVAPGMVIKEETRLLVKNIMDLTPPKTNAQGRAAILGDLNRVVYPLHADTITWAPLKEAVAKRDEAKITALLKKTRRPKQYVKTEAGIQAAHYAARNRRGRVPKGRKPTIAAMRTTARKYLRLIQSRVGWHRSLFTAAYTAAGGRTPNWVRRHSAKASTARYHFGENPFVSATGHDVKIPNFQRVVDNAVKNRERTTITKIERLVTGKAVNLGFARVKL